MAKQLTYRLTNPGYTIYHRAALGGLAATILAWGKNPPKGIQTEVTRNSLLLAWNDEVTDQEALRRIFAASFKLTGDKVIDLPGQGIVIGHDDLRLAIHNGICGTFLQHNKMRPGEKEPGKFPLKTADDEMAEIFTYKQIDSYAHQKAQKTGLLDDKLKGKLADVANIPQSLVPGALSGAFELQAPSEEVILLMYLMVGCPVFLLRPRTYKEKAQYCVIVPDVIDLIAFARALRRIASTGQDIKRFSNSYLGRVVGGAEEAGLRFLVDVQAEEVTSEPSVAGCLAVAMGKVAWDPRQINRSIIVKLKGDYPEMNVFRAANTYLSKSKVIKSKKGEIYAIPTSPVPELVAANLAAERHWCSHFKELVSEQDDFNSMFRNMRGGLKRMREAINDEDDQAILRTFHAAWRRTMGEFKERAHRGEFIFDRKVETESEKMRNAILRAKTADALAGWFLRFCADSTKGRPLSSLRTDATRIREFIFNPRNFERFQNLCLFALVSYGGEDSKIEIGGNN